MDDNSPDGTADLVADNGPHFGCLLETKGHVHTLEKDWQDLYTPFMEKARLVQKEYERIAKKYAKIETACEAWDFTDSLGLRRRKTRLFAQTPRL